MQVSFIRFLLVVFIFLPVVIKPFCYLHAVLVTFRLGFRFSLSKSNNFERITSVLALLQFAIM